MSDIPRHEFTQPHGGEAKKFTRRKFLQMAGVSVGTGIAVDAYNKFAAFHTLYNAGKNMVELAASGGRAVNFLHALESQHELVYHDGPLRFVVPEHIGEYAGQYTDEERRLIEHIVTDATKTLDRTFGGPQRWTDDETSIVMPDILHLMDRGVAQFIDGDNLDRPGRGTNDVARHINMLIIPRQIASDFVDAVKKKNDTAIVYPTYIIHEMAHAYNQSDLPVCVKEGLSKMSEFIYLRAFSPSIAQIYEENVARVASHINVGEIGHERFSEYAGRNADDGDNLYVTVGHLFLNWYDTHPEFFPRVREKENEFFTANKRRPSFDEWIGMSDAVDPAFSPWFHEQPVFSMKD